MRVSTSTAACSRAARSADTGRGKPAFQVVEFHQGIALRIGLDQVVDRLGLQQVQLAVAEGAVGEFAGQRRAGAAAADQGQHPLDDEKVGVQRNLGHVLAAVGSGAAEEHRQAFVDARPRRRG